jgi:DNA-binding NarL/FixJ family response regulator
MQVLIAEPSVIIRSGLISVLKRLPALNMDIVEITDFTQISARTHGRKPDILIVNPSFAGLFSLSEVRGAVENGNLRCIALQNALVDSLTLKNYDETISIYDSAEQIREKLMKLCNPGTDPAETRQELSLREKEVIVCVVKGMTNKQMADHLCLSIHTVITHRRNIATKLQIHSPAGLTIYAILNKLVELNDINDTIAADDL